MKHRITIMAMKARGRALFMRGGIVSGALACLSGLGVASVAQAQPVRGLYINGDIGATFTQGQMMQPQGTPMGSDSPYGAGGKPDCSGLSHKQCHKLNHNAEYWSHHSWANERLQQNRYTSGRQEFDPGIMGSGSVGYGFDNGFRVEVEGGYRENRLGHFHDPGLGAQTSGHERTYDVMANAFFDMDVGLNWLYPYFGAGVGYIWQNEHAGISANQHGSVRNLATGQMMKLGHYNERLGGTAGEFAYQGMFGLAFPLPWVVGLSATTEYRFLSSWGSNRHSWRASGVATDGNKNIYASGHGRMGSKTYFNHSLMLGLRYEFDPAPPPPPPAARTVAAPARAPVRTYLVFFDWNSAALTGRARAIVDSAARSSTAVQFTRVLVNGYTDTSGGTQAHAYNYKLGLKRADAVKAELIRDGVAAGLISVKSYGDTHPLVATGPNVREAQNRRVVIEIK
ncbi:OmpA family protein [Formicincola oecophyllae]|uniref:OmpA family protein n=1 Tax=Formicincola oecophyllae TaxID=2558361 RepID=A0A4Y6U943_9PROT|nr:OmpA family protein [Formicincola oecophyllae]QDH13714.1 OmpA family protein [Formicincola oecophyllae]